VPRTPRTFSMANSSSALTLISRAFSSASCLMKATYRSLPVNGRADVEPLSACADATAGCAGSRTILFISVTTSSSFIGRAAMMREAGSEKSSGESASSQKRVRERRPV
jgi:hypothetical protein